LPQPFLLRTFNPPTCDAAGEATQHRCVSETGPISN